MSRWSLPGEYAGGTYRSHLEGRWAIFFTHLDLKFEYEPQGFATDGQGYLPDFTVFAALGLIWVEIKPDWKEDPEGVAKWRRFAEQRPQPSRTALFAGLPTPHIKPVLIGGDDSSKDPGKWGWEDDTHEWRPCPSGYHFDLAFPGLFRARFVEDGCPDDPDDFGGGGEAKIATASQAALAYRFGKGGTGQNETRGTAA
jgi:hypothetical protein